MVGSTWQFPQGLPDEGTTRGDYGRSCWTIAFSRCWSGLSWSLALGWQPLAVRSTSYWSLASQQESPVELLAAAVNKQGKMIVVLAEPTGAGDAAERTLLYSSRTLELPPKQTAIQEVPTQTLLPPTLTPATPTPERLLTPASTVDSEPANSQGQTDRNETNDPISPFTMALLPVALLLLSVLGIVVRRAARAKIDR